LSGWENQSSLPIRSTSRYCALHESQLEKRYTELFSACFDDHDPALEWCENQLLSATLRAHSLNAWFPPRSSELFQGLTGQEIAVIVPRFKHRRFQRSEIIVSAGR